MDDHRVRPVGLVLEGMIERSHFHEVRACSTDKMNELHWPGGTKVRFSLRHNANPNAFNKKNRVPNLVYGNSRVGAPGDQVGSRGVKKRSRTRLTWFATWPFSQPNAGVLAKGSTR